MVKESGKSVSELVRIALLDLEENFSETYNNVYNKGVKDWAIWCICWKCNRRIYIKPNSDEHKQILKFMGNYLEHSQCPQE